MLRSIESVLGIATVAVEGIGQRFSALALPMDPTSWIANDARVGRDIMKNHGSRANEAVLAQRDSAHNRRVCANRRTFLDQRWQKLLLSVNERTRKSNIGKRAARADKNPIFQVYTAVYTIIILNFTAVPYGSPTFDHDILTDDAMGPDFCAG